MNIEEHITNNNDDSNDNIKFKISMKKLGLCDYSDAYTVVKETITVPERLTISLRIDDKIGDENFDVINEKKKNGKNYKFGKNTKEKIFKYLYYRRFNY